MKRLLATTLLAAAALGQNAFAQSLVELEVRDRDTGLVAPTYMHRGQTYVAGEPGHNYAVRLTNRTGGRVLAVLSVDGVNAVSGQTAGAQQAGYVLSPYESAEINGWRKNLSEVAQFVFSSPEGSYASRTGRPQNVGVIGVAVFQEKLPWPRYRFEEPQWRGAPGHDDGYGRYKNEADKSRSADGIASAPPASAPAPAESESSSKRRDGRYAQSGAAPDLGTGHGRREWAPVGTTEFQRRSSRPDEVVSLQYRSPEFLVDNGIAPRCDFNGWRGCRPSQPEAFPLGFVPDPY